MFAEKLKSEGHGSPSWTGSDFDHTDIPALSLVRAYGRNVRTAELVVDILIH